MRKPYVVLKYACSSNNVFAIANQQIWLSNLYTKRLVHKWRSEIAAILVGTNTAKIDNPQLNNRLYYGAQPLKIVIDRHLTINKQAALFADPTNVLLVVDEVHKTKSISYAEPLFLPFNDQLMVQILEVLYQRGINDLLVEGGVNLLNQFIQQELWDEARIITSKELLPSRDAIYCPAISGKLKARYKIGTDFLEVITRETI